MDAARASSFILRVCGWTACARTSIESLEQREEQSGATAASDGIHSALPDLTTHVDRTESGLPKRHRLSPTRHGHIVLFSSPPDLTGPSCRPLCAGLLPVLCAELFSWLPWLQT
jgi:hypothetical protein